MRKSANFQSLHKNYANEKYQAGYEETEDVHPVPMNAWKYDGPLNKQAVYKDGIMIASNTMCSYGKMARYKDVTRIE